MIRRVISYGGGVQSTALVVLAAQGKIGQVDAALFCNVGDDSEHPATIRYVHDVAMPFAEAHGLAMHELHRTPARGKFAGQPTTLMEQLNRTDSRSIPIPMRMPDGGAPGTRNCTKEFKIQLVSRWLKDNGVTVAEPAEVLLGISTDEYQRAGRGRDEPRQLREYPLLDLRLSRQDCMNVIADAGLPVPPKSSCFFCPFQTPQRWAEMRRDEPDLFWQSVELERTLNDRRDKLGKDHVYLTRFGAPLDEAIAEAQDQLPGFESWAVDDGGCDSGHCFT